MILAALLVATASPGASCPTGLPHAPAGVLRPPAHASYLTPGGAVRIVGYNDMAGIVAGWDAAFEKLHPGVRFAPNLPATRAAPPALIQGRSAFAPMGAEMNAEDLRGATRTFGASPLMIAVAHDSLSATALSGPLGVVVAKANPIRSLSLTQVARLYSSDLRVARWGNLGLGGAWRNRPIHRIGLRPETALAQRLKRTLFPHRSWTPDMIGLGQSRDVASAVARDPLAIGFAGVNAVGGSVRPLPLAQRPGEPAIAPTRANLRSGRYPLDRQLLIYARPPLDPFVRAYLDFVLSCEGQMVVAADPKGYIPLTARQAETERRKLAEDAQPGEVFRRTSSAAPITLQTRGRRSTPESP